MVIEQTKLTGDRQIQETLLSNQHIFPDTLRRERGIHLLVPGQPVPEGFPLSRILHVDLHPASWILRDVDRLPIRLRWGKQKIEIAMPGKSASLFYTTDVSVAVKDISPRDIPRKGDTLYIFDQSHLREVGLVALYAPYKNRPYHVRIVPVNGVYENGEIPRATVKNALAMLRSDRVRKITYNHISQ